MLPGFLHLDLRRGCTADMLVSSLSALIGSVDALQSMFTFIGMPEISVVVVKDAVNGIKGQVVQFYVNDIKIQRSLKFSASKPFSSKILPKWNLTKGVIKLVEKPQKTENIERISSHDFVHDCLNNRDIAINSIAAVFENSNIKPEISALAIKILENLACDHLVDQKLSGMDALWAFCHLFSLALAIHTLDPKYISATKIQIFSEALDKEKRLALSHPVWIRQILHMLPTYEGNERIHLDVLALAFVKTLVGHFGPRGESVILQLGIGLSPVIDHLACHFIEALWCEAKLPESMSEIGPSNQARISFRHKVEGLVPATENISTLIATMSLHGAQSLSYVLVHGERNSCFYLVRFSVTDDNKREAIEAFLIKGNAKDVSLHATEHHDLNKRLVNVPLGSGNKTSSLRFYEYIYLDKIVHVEPHKEDLELYVKTTDYSMDVARGDLLMAWKKWRGRMVEEQT